MDFQYIAYTGERKIIKGKVSASSEETALELLNYGGYKVLNLKEIVPFVNLEKLSLALTANINPHEIIMFSRQLALLVGSGTDVVSALELLEGQIANRTLRKITAEVVNDVRGGLKLSQALEKHPKAFSPLYCRTVAVSEETGNLEVSLRHMAGYIEKQATTVKKIKSAMIYPIIALVLAIAVVAILVVFVLPPFMGLYSSMGVELPAITRFLLAVVDFLTNYGLYILIGIAALIVVGFVYTKTPVGAYQWDKFKIKSPQFGRIIILSELSRCSRIMALMFRAGVSLPEIMTLVIKNAGNKVLARALTQVREDMLGGQGLSQPMSRNPIFPPLMVQMAGVGEGTGNLDSTMDTVADSYEMEADDRTSTFVALIQPAMTIFIGALVGFIALTLISTMYSIIGSVGG
ncbi:MAG: type II secretion system F family protein [Chloroflexota bacterium]|nr:type II secretion system F family protein [Chloroflexota bacterium]